MVEKDLCKIAFEAWYFNKYHERPMYDVFDSEDISPQEFESWYSAWEIRGNLFNTNGGN